MIINLHSDKSPAEGIVSTGGARRLQYAVCHALFISGLIVTTNVYPSSLHEVLDKAWAKSPQAQLVEAKLTESDALEVAANSLLPGAPALVVSHRGDELYSNNGQQEWEAGIALPIWLPGQRDARQHHARALKDGLEASVRAMRLKLAGELREAVWQVRLAEVQTRQHEDRAQAAQDLADDVAKRVRAGELAKVDLNLAQNEWRTAQLAVLQNRNRLLQAQQAYAALTGIMTLPDDGDERVQSKPLSDEHPLLDDARKAIESAEAQVNVAAKSPRDYPEVSLSSRRERVAQNDAYANTMTIALRLPLSTDARNQPLMSATRTSLIEAQGEYNRARLMLEYQILQAEQALQLTDQQLDIAREQQVAARENHDLIKKSFSLGEADLFALLRARTSFFEAEQTYHQQIIAQSLARARVNQAQGVMP